MAAVEETIDGGVATLRLAEPDSRNALSPAIRAILEARIPALVDDPEVRCILLTGSGRSFCAGGDIRSLADPGSPEDTRRRLARSHAWLARLLDGETPVITAVNGAAIGAGFGLAMTGDIILAADTAWFLAGFPSIGVAADYGLGRTLPRAVGAPRAKDILLSGRRVEAAEALAIGMVSRVVPEAELAETARALALQLAAGPVVALGLTKRLIGSDDGGPVAAYLDREGFAQSVAFATSDYREGVDAFLAKRAPRFEGR